MGAATGAVADAGEVTSRRLLADVGGVAAVTGTVAAGELAAAAVPAALFTGLPWLGVTVSTTAAAAAATARSVIAPVTIPVRKLTSSSRALMTARTLGREPAVRWSPPFTTPDDTDERRSMAA
ncbi:MAG TPA: hypothetical protein VHT26_17925 [Trebonia sp.]|nr:hypothetical protein [Trebonia sp.]